MTTRTSSCRGYDRGEGRRRWRALDLGVIRAVLEADAPRVSCPEHGVVVAAVPWARHGAGHTRVFDDTVAWLAVQCSKTAVGLEVDSNGWQEGPRATAGNLLLVATGWSPSRACTVLRSTPQRLAWPSSAGDGRHPGMIKRLVRD